ncbi:MAG: hypothetical protein FGF48_10025 [Candidatus Brockarchaeota archaeon]|nr:hypothetical protein [Candidatus Brockarchaeota archaeon]
MRSHGARANVLQENGTSRMPVFSVAAIIWGSNGVIVNSVSLNAYAIAFLRVLFASIVLTLF